MVNANLLLKF